MSHPHPKRHEHQKHSALTFIDTLLSSQRTRTHHTTRKTLSPGVWGNRSSLTQLGLGHKARRLGERLSYTIIRNPVQPRCHVREDLVGVRVALTRQKLRQEELFRKSPGHRVAIVNNGLCAVRVRPLR